MNRRLVLALYLAAWVAIAIGVAYFAMRSGYSVSVAVAIVFVLFFLVNGSLAYRARARQLRLEGKEPPQYLRYLFFPQGPPKFKEQAPKSTHILVGIAATLTGVFLVFCGVALAFDAKWSRISQPFLVGAACVVVAIIGVVFLYLAWRLLSFGKKSRSNAA